MTLPSWFLRFIGREFPNPPAENLALEDLFDFYHRLKPDFRRECKIFVYRMDPAKAPFKSLHTLSRLPEKPQDLIEQSIFGAGANFPEPHAAETALMPPASWWYKSDMPRPWTAVFCVRIQRNWKTQYGSRAKEVCLSTFEVPAGFTDDDIR